MFVHVYIVSLAVVAVIIGQCCSSRSRYDRLRTKHLYFFFISLFDTSQLVLRWSAMISNALSVRTWALPMKMSQKRYPHEK